MAVGWWTLLEECGDALLDDGSKQLPFYFAIWRFDGEMWARRSGGGRGGQSQRERARVFGAFSGLHTTLATGNWARPLPAVSASTVTSQSYSVNPVVTAAFSSSVHCYPGYTALKHSPLHGTVLTLCFLFVFCSIVAFSCSLLFSECWLPAVIRL